MTSTPSPQKTSPVAPSKLISGSIVALLAGSASSASGQITLGGAGFTVDNTEYLWDVDDDGHDDFKLTDYFYVGTGPNPIVRQRVDGLVSSVSGTETAGWMAASLSDQRISPINVGVFVDVSAHFVSGAAISSAGVLQAGNAVGFTDGGTSYIGFRFYRGTDTHYGWAQITTNWGNSNSLVVHQWAWNATPFEGIDIGETPASAVPEPSTYALGLGALALGAAGVRRWRKQQPVAA